MGKKIILDKNILYQKYVKEKKTIKQIACELGIDESVVSRNLKENNIQIEQNRNKFHNPPITFSDHEMEIINGALLGDGCLTCNGRSQTNALFSYTSKSREHVEFVCKDLMRFCSSEIKNISYFDKRTNKEYQRALYRSQLNISFTKLREKWYPNGIKIIPKDLILTPLTVLIWYLGDGSLLTRERSQYIHLCTDNFKKEDIENILLPQLSQFEPHLIESKSNQYRIYIPRRKIKNFLNYIGDCPVNDYLYKWDFKEYKYEPLSNYPEKIKKIIIAYKNGSSPGTIAKYFNIDRSTVLRCLENHNIDSTLNRFSKKEVDFHEEE